MAVTKLAAEKIIAAQAALADAHTSSPVWLKRIEDFSILSAPIATPKTHIAMLGTALLAKATDMRADLREVKPSSSSAKEAYSARTLCHGVLVPAAARYGFNLGTTGREPLNNQPYFRIRRLGDGTPVSKAGQAVFDQLLALIGELEQLSSPEEALAALRAFIHVRRQYQPKYGDQLQGRALSLRDLAAAITSFVTEDSQGGRRAQAIAAAIVDVLDGPERVESGRINDPSRKTPGDVVVFSSGEDRSVQKAIEVRDKPVTTSDVLIFANKCLAFQVPDAAVLAVSAKPSEIDGEAIQAWSEQAGIAVTIISSWMDLLAPVVFWSDTPTLAALSQVVARVGIRLEAVEAGPEALARWQELVA